MGNNRVIAGFITYNNSTAKYLPIFLPSLVNQSFKDLSVVCVDNSDEEGKMNYDHIRENFPDIKIEKAGENLGFARAYNRMIREAEKEGAEFFLMLNPDMMLDERFVEEMVSAAEENADIAAVAPKILKWDFKKREKTSIIDSCGVGITPEHRFFDIGCGQEDKETPCGKPIFGFTGAAALLRISALRDVAFTGEERIEYLDELMFMYKEDCDLSYRLRLAGRDIVFAPKAICYHDRTAGSKGEGARKIFLNRFRKSKQVRKWSFLNHWILIFKIKDLPFSAGVRFRTFFYQLKCSLFALIFEPFLLTQFRRLWFMRGDIKKRAKQLKVRVKMDEIERLMD